jgi:excisionase family DNA binding protein
MIKVLQEIVTLLHTLNTNIRPPTVSNTLKHYSIEDTASIMGVSENTVRNWIKDGVIKPFQYRGTLRIKENIMERFITKYTG